MRRLSLATPVAQISIIHYISIHGRDSFQVCHKRKELIIVHFELMKYFKT